VDNSRFDQFTRIFALSRSRRTILKTLAGSVFGGALGLAGLGGGVEAKPTCRDEGHPCEGNQTCCDGLVCVASGRGTAKRCNRCPNGQIACGGKCIGACVASDACHAAGVCDPKTGTCTNPPVAAGTPCGGDNPCNGGGTCDGAGTCQAGTPMECGPCQACDPADGNCRPDAGQDGESCPGDDKCFGRHVCQGGRCAGVDPVVCGEADACHGPGECVPATGTCTYHDLPDGTPCAKGNACLGEAACLGGECRGGTPVVCTTDNPCLTARCEPERGCVFTPKESGTACGDGNVCNGDEQCDGEGHCQPGKADTCDPCWRCNREDGVCEPDPAQNGNTCLGDGNSCFGGFQCAAGACVGVDATVCTPLDDCHVAGECVPETGDCSNPNAADGTLCAAGPNQRGTCTAGVCTGGGSGGGSDAICVAVPDGCGSGAGRCDDGSASPCYCFTTTEDTVRCSSADGVGSCADTCTSSAECPGATRSDGGTFGPGAFCARADGCCGEGVNVCLDPCSSYCTVECTCPRACIGGSCVGPGERETGTLTADDPVFERCNGFGVGHLYHAYTFSHDGGALAIGVRGAASGGGTIEDTYLYLYEAFDPANPCDGLAAANDDNECSLESRITGYFPGGIYTAVVTTYRPDVQGSYALEFNRCSPCGH
jgi:hypothetical protein